MPPWNLNGKAVLITGGAGGIGLASGKALAARGARIAVVDLDEAAARSAAAEIGPQAIALRADVTDPGELEAAVAATLSSFGAIDAVFANAGLSTHPPAPFRDTPAEAYERVIEVNLLGVVRTARATVEALVASGGYLLCNASVSAAVPLLLGTSYSAAKAGVENFAMGLRGELACEGVDVGVAVFGFIDTDLPRRAFADPATAQVRRSLPAAFTRFTPVSKAGAAVADGIERRARLVAEPRWVPALLAARGLIAPLADRRQRRDPTVAEAVRLGRQRAAERAPAATPAREP